MLSTGGLELSPHRAGCSHSIEERQAIWGWKRSETLIAADALTVAQGELAWPNPAVDFDRTLAGTSLTKLARYEIERVITYHGGLYQSPANERIAELSREG